MLSDMISLFLSFFFWELMVEVVHIAFMILKFKVSLRVVRCVWITQLPRFPVT